MTNTLPPDRYPSTQQPARRRKLLTWGLGGLVVVIGVVVALFAYNRFSVHDIDATVISFDVADDSTVNIRLTVTRDDPHQAGECVLRARSKDGSETGRREIYLPPGNDKTVEMTVPVRTSQPPGMGDVYGCSLDVPAYLHAN